MIADYGKICWKPQCFNVVATSCQETLECCIRCCTCTGTADPEVPHVGVVTEVAGLDWEFNFRSPVPCYIEENPC